jgi:acetamidase/formamidase
MAIHYFRPSHYHTAIGAHTPVLRLADGDTVITTTVDARGFDATGERVTAGGNPQTGPFYIEGAEPGDTLAVHLDRLLPNRDHGWTAAMVAPHVVDPEYVVQLPSMQDIVAEWHIDRDRRIAMLVSPNTALGRLILPVVPMLGCFGVAPSRGQSISTATSGVHGGNMDYRGFVAGVTVYFPVFVAGALFHLGDGHAVQGEGEVVGTGIEVSLDVQFTARLIKGKRIMWPRGENGTHLFTVGNARPLDQAVQHATTEMMRWLADDYGLDECAASILLGQCAEYDVGNVYDPAFSMVCKVSKHLLEREAPARSETTDA